MDYDLAFTHMTKHINLKTLTIIGCFWLWTIYGRISSPRSSHKTEVDGVVVAAMPKHVVAAAMPKHADYISRDHAGSQ